MSGTTRFAADLYAALLHLYPCSFHAEFGEEMEAVFADAMEEATDRDIPVARCHRAVASR